MSAYNAREMVQGEDKGGTMTIQQRGDDQPQSTGIDSISPPRYPRLLGAVVLFLTSCPLWASGQSLIATITPAASSRPGLWLEVALHNASSEPQALLTWNTPFEGTFNADMFRITGIKATYTGRLVKRAKPQQGQIRLLQPDETITTVIDLAQGYDLERAGAFQAQLATTMQRLPAAAAKAAGQDAAAQAVPQELRSDPVAMQARSADLHEPHPEPQVGTTACSAAEGYVIAMAAQLAEVMAQDAVTALQGTPPEARSTAVRYTTWFGAHDIKRYQIVVNHFTAIQEALPKVYVQCGCNDPSMYAYVVPKQPYTIHVCPVFWDAPLGGTDSKAGTLVHETSHFTVVAGTQDHAYGQQAAMELATAHPEQAIANADNHEYFAENNPELPMSP